MSAEDYFSKTYQGTRTKFLAACRELRLQPTGYSAPDGPPEPPLIDCLRLGNPSADHILVICGGDRKTDALCCSAIETGWLREFGKANLPADTAILLLHHGAAPATGGEVPGAAASPPPQWEDDILAKVEERYAEYARQQGIDSTGAPLDGPADGDVPGYPGRVLDTLAHAMAPAADGKIVLIEIRVGTGPWGEAELTPRHPQNSAGARRVREWFSLPAPSEEELQETRELDSLGAGLRRRFPQADITAASASFGTYSMMSVLENLAARPEGRAIPETAAMVYPEDPAWRDAVWKNAIVVIQRVLTRLHAE
jgi:hypothetical protein